AVGDAGQSAKARRARDQLCHPGTSLQRLSQRGSLATAVPRERHVMGQQCLKSRQVALLGRLEEADRQLLLLLARGLEAGPPLVDVPPCPAGELAHVVLALPDDL